MNLSGVKTSEIKKGCSLAAIGSMESSLLLDVKLNIINNTPRIIENNSLLHFYHGTDDTLARVVLFGKDELKKGESCYAQLHLSKAFATRPGDHFVVRFYSPMETIGGGIILDPNPSKRKRSDESIFDIFSFKENGTLQEKVSAFVLDRSRNFPKPADLKLKFFADNKYFDENLASLVKNQEVLYVKDSVVHIKFLKFLGSRCKGILNDFHTKNPLLDGMRKDELRTKLLPEISQSYADETINLIEKLGFIKFIGNLVSNVDFNVIMTNEQKYLYDKVVKKYLDDGFSTLSLDELLLTYPAKESNNVKQILTSLLASGTLIALTSQIFIHKDFYNKAIDKFTEMYNDEPITLGSFRDELKISRKYAVAILEHFDKKNITKLQGEARILLKQ